MKISITAKLEELGYNVESLAGMEPLFKAAVAGLAQQARDEWSRLAQQRLRTSRDIYLQGLRQAESFKTIESPASTNFEISLVGQMANNIEFGMPPFDMKAVRPGWLGGAKAKTGKGGKRYVVIPFRHSVSSTSNIAYTGKAKAQGLEIKLKAAVKEYGLDRTVRTATGQVKAGPVKRIPKTAPVHPYLRGLTRVQQPTAGGRRGTGRLMTWRIMSENSPADSWIHPGLPAQNLLREVEQFVDREMSTILDKIAGGT